MTGFNNSLLLIRVCLIYNFPARKAPCEFTTKQTSLFMTEFCRSPYLTPKRRKHLLSVIGLGTVQIDNWYERYRSSLRSLEAQISWKGT